MEATETTTSLALPDDLFSGERGFFWVEELLPVE
jgi:hypothetical protein